MTLEQIEQEAYIAACELVGPNAIEFDEVRERIEMEIINKHYPTLEQGDE